ncbi:hypothetical protein ACIREO_03250 [Streptomyces sp. NPDC102441]|uniref:hypothetical protein n=1 Tax=Streptomyces sp. NPDC102441 TaxID=3366176 RepID=UPI0037FAEC08
MTVLDAPVTVKSGHTFEAKSLPYQPRVAAATSSHESLPHKYILQSLSDQIGKELAKLDVSTTIEKRVMSAKFPEAGQAVYYRGVKEIAGSYSFNCPTKKAEISGTFFSWEVASSTTGLVDCLVDPSKNSDSKLARMAISKRCPAGSPARAVLAQAPSG